MAFLTKKEFADRCGMTTGNLSNYISRKKVFLSGDLIDDTIGANAEFLLKWAKIASEKNISSDSAMVKNTKAPIEPNTKAPNIAPPEIVAKLPKTKRIEGDEQLSLFQLEKQKKQLDIEKTSEEITHLQLKNEKLQGDNIPTSLVKEVFKRHSKNIVSGFKSGIENLLIEFEKIANLNREHISTMRGKMISIINETIVNATEESKKEVANIVKEVSIKKGVGERE